VGVADHATVEELLDDMCDIRQIYFDDLYAPSVGAAERAEDKFATLRLLHRSNHEIKLVFR
jgi:hypothetical protein